MKKINGVIFESLGDVTNIVGRGTQGRPLGGGDI